MDYWNGTIISLRTKNENLSVKINFIFNYKRFILKSYFSKMYYWYCVVVLSIYHNSIL